MTRITVSPEDQLKELKRGAFEIIPEEELLKKLKKSYEKQKPLVIILLAQIFTWAIQLCCRSSDCSRISDMRSIS
jgi:hypothetical protein